MRKALLFSLLALTAGAGGALLACVGDDPGATTGPGATDGSVLGDGSSDAATDGPSNGDPDSGDGGDLEPTPDGGIVSVEHFPLATSFPGGTAKVAYGPDGSLVIGFTFQGETTLLGTKLASNSNSEDIGVAKIGADGKLAWLKGYGGSSGDSLYGLAVDGAGDVYIAGEFASASVTFEVARPLDGVSHAPFVAKLAGATGTALKSATFHKPNDAGGRCDSVAVRAGVVGIGCTMDGTAQVTLNTAAKIDVDAPGPGTGILLAELDPTSLGAIWANGLGSAAGDYVAGVDVTPAGDLVFAGVSGDATDVALTDTKGSVNVTVRRSPSTVVGRFAKASGLASWVKAFGSATSGSGLRAQGVASDAAANILVCAQLTGTIDIGGKTITRSNAGSGFEGMAIAKLRQDGTTIDARSFGGSSDELIRGIATDRWNNVLVTGRYTSGDFVIDGHTMPAPAAPGNQVLFAIKMSPALVAQWGVGATTGGGSLIQGQGIATALSGRVAYVGVFGGTADFGDGTPRQSNGNGNGYNAAVVTRLP